MIFIYYVQLLAFSQDINFNISLEIDIGYISLHFRYRDKNHEIKGMFLAQVHLDAQNASACLAKCLLMCLSWLTANLSGSLAFRTKSYLSPGTCTFSKQDVKEK